MTNTAPHFVTGSLLRGGCGFLFITLLAAMWRPLAFLAFVALFAYIAVRMAAIRCSRCKTPIFPGESSPFNPLEGWRRLENPKCSSCGTPDQYECEPMSYLRGEFAKYKKENYFD